MSSSALPIRDHFSTDHLLADLKGRSVRGGAITLTAQAIKFVLQMGSTMVLARLLAPADFGLIAMVVVVTGFAAMFKDAGLSMATVQREHITHEQVSTLFWINVALSVVIMLVVAALAPAIAWFYDEPQLTWITLALAGTFIFSGLTVQHQALLRRQMRFRALAVIEILSLAVGIAAGITMAVLDFGYWSLVGMAAGMVVSNCVLVWLVSDWRPGRPVRGCGVRPLLAFGGNLTGFDFVNYFARNADRLLIGWFWGSASLGLYSKAYSLLYLPITQINGPVAAVVIPSMSRIQDDDVRYRSAYLKALTLTSWLFMPLVALLVATANEVVWLVLGGKWMAAVPIFQFLGISALILPISDSTGWLFVSSGRTDRMFRWGVFASTIYVVLFMVTVPYGVNTLALAFGVAGLIMSPLCLIYATRGNPVTVKGTVNAVKWPLISALIGGLLAFGFTRVCDADYNRFLVLVGGALAVMCCGLIGLLWSGHWRIIASCVSDFTKAPDDTMSIK